MSKQRLYSDDRYAARPYDGRDEDAFDAVSASSSETCPKCQRSMRVQANRLTGEAFLGCTGFPDCKGTRKV